MKGQTHAHGDVHTFVKIVPAFSFLRVIILSFIQGMRRKKKNHQNKPNEKNPQLLYIQGHLTGVTFFLHLRAINTLFSHLCANMKLVAIIGFSSKKFSMFLMKLFG